MKLNSQRTFRKCLNLIMGIAILGTVPYIFVGDSLYRHEVFGLSALLLVLYHCLLNKWWYSCLLQPSAGNTTNSALQRRTLPNLFLSLATVVLLLSSVMISDALLGALAIPYHIFWHYVHLVSGAAFFLLVLLHVFQHRR